MASKTDKSSIEALYNKLIKSWNDRNTREFSNCFAAGALSIGFDGSEANGREEIFKHIDEVFKHHQTAAYVTIIKEVNFISDDVGILRAYVGMVPPGGKDINPDVNSIQTIVVKRKWHMADWAAPKYSSSIPRSSWELAEKLTNELREQPTQIKTRISRIKNLGIISIIKTADLFGSSEREARD